MKTIETQTEINMREFLKIEKNSSIIKFQRNMVIKYFEFYIQISLINNKNNKFKKYKLYIYAKTSLINNIFYLQLIKFRIQIN